MRFLLDHDVPSEVERVLVQAGHTVVTVRSIMPASSSDDEVLNRAIREELALISCNRDDFISRSAGLRHSGLIILIRRRTRIAECSALLRLIARAGEEGIYRNINFA